MFLHLHTGTVCHKQPGEWGDLVSASLCRPVAWSACQTKGRYRPAFCRNIPIQALTNIYRGICKAWPTAGHRPCTSSCQVCTSCWFWHSGLTRQCWWCLSLDTLSCNTPGFPLCPSCTLLSCQYPIPTSLENSHVNVILIPLIWSLRVKQFENITCTGEKFVVEEFVCKISLFRTEHRDLGLRVATRSIARLKWNIIVFKSNFTSSNSQHAPLQQNDIQQMETLFSQNILQRIALMIKWNLCHPAMERNITHSLTMSLTLWQEYCLFLSQLYDSFRHIILSFWASSTKAFLFSFLLFTIYLNSTRVQTSSIVAFSARSI